MLGAQVLICEPSLLTVPVFQWGSKQPKPSTTTPCTARLEEATYLEDTHAEGITQDLVGFTVVAVANVCGGYEKLKGVILLYVQGPTLYFLL